MVVKNRPMPNRMVAPEPMAKAVRLMHTCSASQHWPTMGASSAVGDTVITSS